MILNEHLRHAVREAARENRTSPEETLRLAVQSWNWLTPRCRQIIAGIDDMTSEELTCLIREIARGVDCADKEIGRLRGRGRIE